MGKFWDLLKDVDVAHVVKYVLKNRGHGRTKIYYNTGITPLRLTRALNKLIKRGIVVNASVTRQSKYYIRAGFKMSEDYNEFLQDLRGNLT